GNRDERVASAGRRAGTVVQPPPADIGLVDPGRVMVRGRQVLQDPARIGILPPGAHRREPPPVALDLRRTPVREVDMPALLTGHDSHSSRKPRNAPWPGAFRPGARGWPGYEPAILRVRRGGRWRMILVTGHTEQRRSV